MPLLGGGLFKNRSIAFLIASNEERLYNCYPLPGLRHKIAAKPGSTQRHSAHKAFYPHLCHYTSLKNTLRLFLFKPNIVAFFL